MKFLTETSIHYPCSVNWFLKTRLRCGLLQEAFLPCPQPTCCLCSSLRSSAPCYLCWITAVFDKFIIALAWRSRRQDLGLTHIYICSTLRAVCIRRIVRCVLNQTNLRELQGSLLSCQELSNWRRSYFSGVPHIDHSVPMKPVPTVLHKPESCNHIGFKKSQPFQLRLSHHWTYTRIFSLTQIIYIIIYMCVYIYINMYIHIYTNIQVSTILKNKHFQVLTCKFLKEVHTIF